MKNNLITKIRERFIPTPRGKLLRERILTPKSMNLYMFFIFGILIFLGAFFGAIQYLSSIENETTRLSALVAIVLASQLLIILFQFAHQIGYKKFLIIPNLPQISVEGKLISIETKRGRDTGVKRRIIEISNKGTNAYNVSYGIKVEKNIAKKHTTLFTLEKDNVIEMHTMGPNDFLAKRIDVHITFEDITNFERSAHFRKDAKESTFRTIETGL